MNIRQERFAELVASGVPAMRAYVAAGYSPKGKNAEANACRLMENDGVKRLVVELRAKTSAKLDLKREDLARHLWNVVMTPIGQIDGSSPLCAEFTEEVIVSGSRGKFRKGKASSRNVVTGETIVRRRVKSIGKIEAARLLCEIMGWREPEKITVDAGRHNLDDIRERARSFKSPLNRLHDKVDPLAVPSNASLWTSPAAT